MALAVLLLLPLKSAAMTNGVALVPPMGYNSWYGNGAGITEALIKNVADQMATNGLKAAGYQYVNLDDGWAGYRDTNGVMVSNPTNFPSGIKALADYIHAKGLKIGIYGSGGPYTCAHLPGSQGHEVLDANTYASWGIDYLKYEGCWIPGWELVPHEQLLSMRMGQALLNCGRPIVFSLSIGPSENWIPDACNLPRGTGDWGGTWEILLYHVDVVAKSPFPGRPGMFNDPDVIPIGFGFSPTEVQSAFSMYCILAAPLLTPSVDSYWVGILGNTEAIAVDQDVAGLQGVCVATNGDLQIFRKPLGSNNSTTVAVALLNRGSNVVSGTVNWSDIGVPPGVATVRDLWAHGFAADPYAGNVTNHFTTNVAPHGTVLLKIVPGTTIPMPTVGTNFVSDLQMLASTSNQYEAIVLDKFVGIPTSQISLHGVTYTKGLGVQAYSRAEYFLGKTATRFQSDVGVDDRACCSVGSVMFRVYGDGVKLYDSGLVTSSTPTRTIDIDVTGRTVLALEVTTAGDGERNDQADWAGARIVVPSVPTQPVATGSASQILVTWNPVPGATNYNVKRSLSNGGPFQLIGSTNATRFTDTNVVAGTFYYYAVTAMRSGVESSNSIPVASTPVAFWKDIDTTAYQNWNVNSNWTNTSVYPNAPGASATINANIPTDQAINLNQNITVGSLSIGDPDGSSTYYINGFGGSLIFSNGPNPALLTQLPTSKGDVILAPVILNCPVAVQNLSTHAVTIAGPISAGGNGALTVNGPGVVTLSGTNTIQNAVTVSGGTLRIGNSSALGSVSTGTTVAIGATLDLNGFSLGAKPITIAGAGFNGGGALVSSAPGVQTNALQFLTLAGDAVLGGVGRWDIRGTNAAIASGALSTGSDPHNLTKTGRNEISIASVTVDPSLADIDIQQGILGFEGATTSMGNPNNTLTVEPGASLSLRQSSTFWNKKITLNGDGVTFSVNDVSGSNTVLGPIALNGMCVLGVSGTALDLKGAIAGSGDLAKTSSGSLFLDASNTYTGKTLVKSGALSIGSTGSIATSTNINVAAGALFDVSKMPGGGATLSPGQTLGGAGTVTGNVVAGQGSIIDASSLTGNLTFSNSLAFTTGSQCVVTIGKAPTTNSQIRVTGSLTFGGTLVVDRIGTNLLTAGESFSLFTAGSYHGTFDSISPPVPGPSAVWDTNSLASTGTLKVAGLIAPYFSSTTLNGSNFEFAGAGVRPNATYYILGTTNISLPKFQWTRLATNLSDNLGTFVYSSAITSNAPRYFFCVLVP